MDGRRRFHRTVVVVASLLLFFQNLSLCWSLNNEGLALFKLREKVVRDPFGAFSNWNRDGSVNNPCSWFGVECSHGKVVALNLKDLCLEGTLAPEIGELIYLRSIILRNNSFSGNIPKEIGELKKLEDLDLGYNNFSGSSSFDFSNNPSLTTLLLDNNRFLDDTSIEGYEAKIHPEFEKDEDKPTSCNSRLINWNTAEPGDVAYRRLLQVTGFPKQPKRDKENQGDQVPQSPTPSSSPSLNLPASTSPLPSSASVSPSNSPLSSTPLPNSPSPSPFQSPSPSPFSSPSPSPSSNFFTPSHSPSPSPSPLLSPSTDPVVLPAPKESHSVLSPSPALARTAAKKDNHVIVIMAGVVGGALFILISAIGILFFRSSKVVTVRPWATGLSGQLQKAFVTGVPKLNRSEIVAACEDFSNIIGSVLDGTLYKGTLSSGVEIAVIYSAAKSREDWSKTLEEQFRKKIETLSKVNHKNFVNLIGFCEDEQPFTRIMVFEYAPNGTLFEHLHIKEAEHLDWGMRLRIAMGMAYCLEHIHQLTPPLAHQDLHSSSVYLTEDYAAKISDFRFWNEVTAAKMQAAAEKVLESPSADPESNVYSFGLILFEMITGRIPYSVDNCSLADWASEYLKAEHSLREMVDPTLSSFQEDEVEKLFQVIKDCVHPDPKQRPTMVEITSKLKEITAMGPDGATPKLSPLWWAELEIISSEGN